MKNILRNLKMANYMEGTSLSDKLDNVCCNYRSWSVFIEQDIKTTEIHLLSTAYMGNLVASLTYPARTKAINTFEDLTKLPDDAFVFTSKLSARIVEMLSDATDPTLKVNEAF